MPHVCLKVPTAGGKTFIACNALKTIFDAFGTFDSDRRYDDRPRVVVWLVPSVAILEQTLKNLSNAAHPYRQKINAHFGHRVEVLDKAALLQGVGFNASSVQEQLTIMVFSFDSLRARNKEDRKIFQENGNLQSFEHLVGTENDVTLGAVIKQLHPVVVVDESHNAESELSVDMLKELNPCFILDLTATPRKNSNIISFIDALELKKESMVKLPVIVYNHQDKTEVVNSALQLQRRLELQAKEEESKGGKYIRPIVLFQAQPRTGDDHTTFEKLKAKLVELKIPEEQIRLKTADHDEIKNENLMSRDCPVRYIITVNALKEGWDCPFAYILASLADKSSAVDVEQVLGRVLRQPYVMNHAFPLLNMSYVLTASSKFRETLHNIVKGLNRAGFSEQDYKIAMPEESTTPEAPSAESAEQLQLADVVTSKEDDIDIARIVVPTAASPAEEITTQNIAVMELAVIKQSEAFEKAVVATQETKSAIIPNELQSLMKTYRIKEVFRAQAEQLRLPQFYMKVPSNDLFVMGEKEIPVAKEYLLEDFQLSKADRHITFEGIEAELYRVDLDESKKSTRPFLFV